MNVLSVGESIEVAPARDAAQAAVASDLQRRMHAYWQAANAVSLRQASSPDNVQRVCPLADGEPRGSSPAASAVALNLVYVHLNRLIRNYDLSMILVAGAGDCGAALDAQRYLEATSVDRRSTSAGHRDGLPRLPKRQATRHALRDQASTSGQHKTSEAGRSLLHAYGAAFESPELIVACFVEDAQAEAGTFAAGWHGNTLLDPGLDGAVLPILHLRGIRSCGEDAPQRLSDDALVSTLRAKGYEPWLVACEDSVSMHQRLADTLDAMQDRIGQIQSNARSARCAPPIERPRWPMLILHTPQEWTEPVVPDALAGTFERDTHPLCNGSLSHSMTAASLTTWLESNAPNECFDEHGALRAELETLAPKPSQCLGSNTYTDDGSWVPLSLPERHRYAVIVHGSDDMLLEGRRVLDTCLDDLDALQAHSQSSFYFVTEESLPMRMSAIADAFAEKPACDGYGGEKIADGLAIHALSNDILKEWQEDYKTGGGHTLHACYDAFIEALDARLTQYAARTIEIAQAVPPDSHAVIERTFSRRPLPLWDEAIDAIVAGKEPLDRAQAEKSGCYTLKRSGLENIACSCGRLHHETHACGESHEQYKRSVAEFEIDEMDQHDAAHARWSY